MIPLRDPDFSDTVDLMSTADQRAMLEALGPDPRRDDVLTYLKTWWLAHAPAEALVDVDAPARSESVPTTSPDIHGQPETRTDTFSEIGRSHRGRDES